jgi:hypothetical protein
MSEYYPTVSLDGTPKFLSQQVRYKSASEVTEAGKRRVVNNYYSNYPQSQKAAYASTYTTFKAGAVYKTFRGNSVGGTCCINTNGFVQASRAGEKATPNMNVASKAVINNPQ